MEETTNESEKAQETGNAETSEETENAERVLKPCPACGSETPDTFCSAICYAEAA